MEELPLPVKSSYHTLFAFTTWNIPLVHFGDRLTCPRPLRGAVAVQNICCFSIQEDRNSGISSKNWPMVPSASRSLGKRLKFRYSHSSDIVKSEVRPERSQNSEVPFCLHLEKRSSPYMALLSDSVKLHEKTLKSMLLNSLVDSFNERTSWLIYLGLIVPTAASADPQNLIQKIFPF